MRGKVLAHLPALLGPQLATCCARAPPHLGDLVPDRGRLPAPSSQQDFVLRSIDAADPGAIASFRASSRSNNETRMLAGALRGGTPSSMNNRIPANERLADLDAGRADGADFPRKRGDDSCSGACHADLVPQHCAWPKSRAP
jgi:hypothetical protein